MKKTEVLFASGKSIFIQHRDPSNHVISWESIQQFPEDSPGYACYAKKWLTYTVLIVFKKVVGTSSDTTYELSAGVTRKYSYAILADNADACASNPVP